LIHENKDSLAMVMLGGINYYNGQVLDMPLITQTAQAYGIVVGFDLAHCVGNIPLQLHEWGIDFAVWCSYKYLNSGMGGFLVYLFMKNIMPLIYLDWQVGGDMTKLHALKWKKALSQCKAQTVGS
jgi:kynureninase